MLEDKARQHDQQVVDKYHDPVAAYTMTTRDYVMRPSANNITGAFILTLPPVAEAKGRFYSILPRDADVVNTITITDQNDSECWIEDIVLAAPCQAALMYSDGLFWHAMGLQARPGLATTVAPETENPTTVAPTTLATSAAPGTGQGTTVAPTTTLTTVAPTTTLTTPAP
jgi:hypothetical protein